MSLWEKPVMQNERPQQRRKTPSFSASLLEAIYLSIDESKDDMKDINKRTNGVEAEDDLASLRRAILIEKWMENYKYTQSSGQYFSSDSSSSTESSIFSSETERSTPTSSRQVHETLVPKCEGGSRLMRTKSRALKIYGDLKKVKQPISPGGKITNFLNLIFNSRSLKKNHHQGMEDWSSVRKSRSVNDTCSLATRSSCLINKTPCNSRSKSKRSVRFCPVSVIVDEDSRRPCGHKSIYKNEEPKVGSNLTKSCINGFDDSEEEDDGRSCASSDLFELDNISRDGLPVYGTTSLKMNQVIARGLVM